MFKRLGCRSLTIEAGMIPFSGNPLTGASEKRTDAGWIEARRRGPGTLILPMWRLMPFLLGDEKNTGPADLCLFPPGLWGGLAAPGAACLFRGMEGEQAMCAIDIPAPADPAASGPLGGLGHFREARMSAQLLPLKDAAIMGQAKAMIDWHQRHGFCARCGAPTKAMDGGYRRVCGSCNAEHFPRTDPVVIMLATHGEECLVGRGRHFPPGMYS